MPSGRTIPRFEVIGITGIGEIVAGDGLADIIVSAARAQGTAIEDGDILVVTQKVVSKAEGRTVDLGEVDPSPLALELATAADRDPRLVEVVLRESRSIVRMDSDRGIIICETRHGFVCANAGVDTSNVPGEDFVSLLPEDPDRSAREILRRVTELVPEARLGVVISDTHGRAWREGQTNLAIGVAGMDPVQDYRGTADAFGLVMKVSTIAVADELASAAEMVMGKATGVPVALVRGYEFVAGAGAATTLVRDRANDLFR
jgi:coenzyme F420-0:L-glutamate ligase/coenzyme F420-1:gamma-L-glutamate ligase